MPKRLQPWTSSSFRPIARSNSSSTSSWSGAFSRTYRDGDWVGRWKLQWVVTLQRSKRGLELRVGARGIPPAYQDIAVAVMNRGGVGVARYDELERCLNRGVVVQRGCELPADVVKKARALLTLSLLGYVDDCHHDRRDDAAGVANRRRVDPHDRALTLGSLDLRFLSFMRMPTR